MKLFGGKDLKSNLDDISNQIKDILPRMETYLKSFSQIDLDGIVGIYSPQIDNIIKATEKEYDCRFGAGRFFISTVDNEFYFLRTELYFIDKSQKYYACKSESGPQPMKHLTDSAKTELMEKQEVSFDINPPKN